MESDQPLVATAYSGGRLRILSHRLLFPRSGGNDGSGFRDIQVNIRVRGQKIEEGLARLVVRDDARRAIIRDHRFPHASRIDSDSLSIA
jgi:hypothetical protein